MNTDNPQVLPLHSPIPWKLDEQRSFSVIRSSKDDESIVFFSRSQAINESDILQNDANARHIVHCANNHDALVEALEKGLSLLKSAIDLIDNPDPDDMEHAQGVVAKMEAALLAARKEGM
jgi:hypothetical protein